MARYTPKQMPGGEHWVGDCTRCYGPIMAGGERVDSEGLIWHKACFRDINDYVECRCGDVIYKPTGECEGCDSPDPVL